MVSLKPPASSRCPTLVRGGSPIAPGYRRNAVRCGPETWLRFDGEPLSEPKASGEEASRPGAHPGFALLVAIWKRARVLGGNREYACEMNCEMRAIETGS